MNLTPRLTRRQGSPNAKNTHYTSTLCIRSKHLHNHNNKAYQKHPAHTDHPVPRRLRRTRRRSRDVHARRRHAPRRPAPTPAGRGAGQRGSGLARAHRARGRRVLAGVLEPDAVEHDALARGDGADLRAAAGAVDVADPADGVEGLAGFVLVGAVCGARGLVGGEVDGLARGDGGAVDYAGEDLGGVSKAWISVGGGHPSVEYTLRTALLNEVKLVRNIRCASLFFAKLHLSMRRYSIFLAGSTSFRKSCAQSLLRIEGVDTLPGTPFLVGKQEPDDPRHRHA